MTLVLALSIPVLLKLVRLRFCYCYEARKLAHNWQHLAANAEDEPVLFDPGMVANLLSAARRFFCLRFKRLHHWVNQT